MDNVVRILFVEFVSGDTGFGIDFRVIWSDDAVRHLKARAMTIVHDRAFPVRFDGLVWDITDQKLLLIALQENIRKTNSSQLRPGIIDDPGLEAAIKRYSKEFAQRNKIGVFPDLNFGITFPQDVSPVMFRIKQKWLTNIARHSRAARVEIGLNMSCDNINFNISDNGIGITEHEIKSKKSFGLFSMKERAFSLGGTFDYAMRTAVVLFLNLFLR